MAVKLFELENTIKEQAQKYYSDGSNDLTDEQFDELVDELKKKDPNSEILKTGWGYDVNKDSTPGEKVKHKYGPAGSLEKSHNWEELPKDFRFGTCWASLKLDGLSVVAYYENGKLVRALTRGNGEIGIDITCKIGGRLLPNKLDDEKFTGAVRGEIIMPYDKFEEFKKLHPEAKNPRNSATGLVGMKEITDDLNFLRVYVYTVIGDEGWNESNVNLATIYFMISFLNKNFEYVAPYGMLKYTENDYYTTFENIHEFWEEQYNLPNDGLVLTIGSDVDLDTHYISYDAIAFKFPAEEKMTEVVDVLWEMSKTGYCIPRIQVRPVELSGATVTYATAFNAQYVRDNKIGKGTLIRLTRSGEVIPYVTEIVKATGAELPKVCPDCGDQLYWDGVHLSCLNLKCPNMVKQDLLAWINNLSPLDNFGDTLRLKYIQNIFGEIPTVEDLMTKEDLEQLASVGSLIQDQLFSNMIRNLLRGRFSLEQVLAGLNLPRFGDITCRKLASMSDLVKRIYDTAISDMDTRSLYNLGDFIGNANAESIKQNLWKFTRLSFIYDRIDWEGNSAVEKKGKVAITGKLSVKRTEFEKELRAHGYEPSDSVSKDTIALITDNPNSSSSKNKQADKFGIVKVSESDFRNNYLK